MAEKQLTIKADEPSRTVYFDVLNIMATVFVVWIHFGNEVHWYDGSQVWYWCLLIQVIAYWAVPVFFMLTGANLMGYHKKYDTATFFKRRFSRAVMPYLFWGMLMLFLRIKWGEIQFILDGDVRQLLFTISDIFIHNQMESIYWFFIILFGIYLCMPALTVFSEENNRKKLNYMVLMGTLTISVIPFFYQMVKEYLGVTGIGWNSGLEFPMLGSYLIYPVLGYWAATRDFSKLERIACYATAVLCGALRYHGLRILSERDGFTNQLYMNYKGFPALFLALGVFIFIRYFCEKHKNYFERMSKWLAELSSCSLGVYLIHNLFIREMSSIAFFKKYSFQWYFIWPFVCYGVCVLVVYIVKKIPLIRKVFP